MVATRGWRMVVRGITESPSGTIPAGVCDAIFDGADRVADRFAAAGCLAETEFPPLHGHLDAMGTFPRCKGLQGGSYGLDFRNEPAVGVFERRLRLRRAPPVTKRHENAAFSTASDVRQNAARIGPQPIVPGIRDSERPLANPRTEELLVHLQPVHNLP